MSQSKRFYWLKLKDDFFASPKIKKLRKIAGGDTLTIIYLKMQLLTVKSSGVYIFQSIEPTLEEELALVLDEDLDNVKLTLMFLKAQDLISFDEASNELCLYEAMGNIGSECDSAERVREYRIREEEKKNQPQALHGNETVTPPLHSSFSNISNLSSSSNSISTNEEENKKKNKKKEKTYEEVFAEFEFSEFILSTIHSWLSYKKERKQGYKSIGLRTLLKTITEAIGRLGEEETAKCIEKSIANGWSGLFFEDKYGSKSVQQTTETNGDDNWVQDETGAWRQRK